jgi:hypothetical protein
MGTISSYIMKGLLVAAVLGFVGMGTAKADPTCVAGTLTTYVSTYSTGCTYDGLIFSGFGAGATGVSGLGVSATSTTAENYITITPFIGADGAGLAFTATTGTWTATNGQAIDAEVPFEVSCANGTACLTDIYAAITGTSTGSAPGNGDILTEGYCTTPTPPPFPPSCSQIPQLSIVGTSSSTTAAYTVTGFAATSEISLSKDMGAFENGNGAQGTSTITNVVNEFSTNSTPPPTTPEPSSLLMLGSGLVSLLGFGLRRRGISQQ